METYFQLNVKSIQSNKDLLCGPQSSRHQRAAQAPSFQRSSLLEVLPWCPSSPLLASVLHTWQEGLVSNGFPSDFRLVWMDFKLVLKLFTITQIWNSSHTHWNWFQNVFAQIQNNSKLFFSTDFKLIWNRIDRDFKVISHKLDFKLILHQLQIDSKVVYTYFKLPSFSEFNTLKLLNAYFIFAWHRFQISFTCFKLIFIWFDKKISQWFCVLNRFQLLLRRNLKLVWRRFHPLSKWL